jgi:hypothetical protein
MSARRLTDLEFAPWIDHVFSHPVAINGAAWHFDVDADFWDGPPALSARHLARLFEDPAPPLANFTDAQIAQGLWYLVDSGAGGLVGSALDASLALAERLRFISSIGTLFERLIEPRIAPVLGHLDEKGAAPLNMIAYMWWDIFPAAGGAKMNSQPDPIEAAILAVMTQALNSKHPAIQESALHGLGHWARACPGIVEPAIEWYLEHASGVRPELINYARAARTGCVL